jgi:hypothetical protein
LTLVEEVREAAIALRELEAIAVEMREQRAQLTDEHADGMSRVRTLLRLKLLELHEQGRRK